ncbi:MAG TPA: AMP-binding protein, partial [Acidimicrobiia bacterium]|nr:AMP-binding protein [Acidimicrobiia bacterium]
MNAWVADTGRGETAVGLLQRCAAEVGDAPFLDFGGTSYTYGELWHRVTAYAAGLSRLGLGPDETVVTMLDNNVDAVALWFATNLLGGIWVPINTALKGSFLSHVVADSEARILVCEADFVGRVEQERHHFPAVEHVLVRGVDLEASLLLDHVVAGFERTSDDTALIIYTGGTTGPSKGCVISNGYAFNSARAFLFQTGRTPDELNWSPLPIYHFNLVSGTILGTMLLRGRASIAPRFSVSGFWPDIERTGARMVNLLGSMGALIADMPDTPEMQRCKGQIRVVHGAPFPPALQHIWESRFGAERVGGNSYGLTECYPLTTLEVGTLAPPGSSGRANTEDFDVRLFDDHDREVAPGEVGEVVCRPRRPNVMFGGYWRRPEAVASVSRNFWFHTGDLGRFDEDGFFFFVDRKKDYLRRRGENISSQEMEQAVLAHPALAEVAVHAVPSDLTEDDRKVTAVL